MLFPERAEVGYRDLSKEGRRFYSHPSGFCIFETGSNGNLSLVLIGDSHADSLANDLLFKLEDSTVSTFVQMTAAGCPAARGFAVQNRVSCSHSSQDKRMDMLNQLSEEGELVIVYFARTPMFLSGERFRGPDPFVEDSADPIHILTGERRDLLQAGLLEMNQAGHLILVHPMPELGIHITRYFNGYARIGFPDSLESALRTFPIQMPIDVFYDRAKDTWQLYDEIGIAESMHIRTHQIFCDTFTPDMCVGNDEDYIFYTDSNHPNHIGAHLINERIVRAIMQIGNNASPSMMPHISQP